MAVISTTIDDASSQALGEDITSVQSNKSQSPSSCANTEDGKMSEMSFIEDANSTSFSHTGSKISDLDPKAIAIVGIGLRLPGGIHNTGSLWDLIVNKRETRCRVPKSRYNIDGYYHTSKESGSVAAEYGHFLADSDGLDAFDTSFFTISKAEAEQLDPQQRMLLEVVYECMENGGQVDWRGKNIGVFLGTFNEDWNDLLCKDTQTTGLHKIVSMMDFIVANRVNYEYDLKGPSYV
jgi:acyl transferase domain-containing protein